ncbi:hypothetical protein UFOVP276_63 [uncultured Caudovirales phage]|uniref:Uncharacterized protein n=1 Tax=uncultured Caudovirales phage TaxID=2100421 RepID=A0A6J5LPY9_9CAUD|nr:hypothetical protein UFOVP127_200 [uncultured Caudovirales phage]CAB4135077.1 hypothetical protein UFOVP276_63 [uncultured Caudovirales phage]
MCCQLPILFTKGNPMSDAPGALPLGLSLQRTARPVDPEQLELMGKKAAALYRDSGRTLSESVVETVKEACLSPEQVKRVCEFANTSAYLAEFEKAGEMRNVTFTGGPADPGYVLKDLNDGGNPSLNTIGSDDYTAPVKSYKTASVGMSKIAEAFGIVEDGTKTASAVSRTRDHAVHFNPIEDVNDLRLTIERAKEESISKLSSARILYDDVTKDLCHTVAQAVETGTPMGDVSRAWSGYTTDVRLLKEAMVHVTKHLKGRGHTKEALSSSFDKTASAGTLPNPSHPLVAGYVAFLKVAQAHRVLKTSIDVLDERLTEVNAKLRQMAV